MVRFIFEEPPAPAAADLLPKKGDAASAVKSLERLGDLLPSLGGTAEESETRLRALAEELGVKLGDLLMPLRVAVTGSKVSPPLVESIRVMGMDTARRRAERAIEILKSTQK